ncbi:hypothetical protein Hs30E_07940 [Lactococcus hodotermopsidis]|uniref:Glycosyltransferase 2-like domain-containing protein n=1 Tax=Pseudolactococcus hodotermopsidis TaxID=2709157 RepID=A0A6A0BC37_9LACT|nr:glycosyltransferase [Lactococcus hodotermopsidis]GFH42243.1 hypothetical protein Hs30E_07940 [Lactococcus hodotermopsidis]
MGFKIRNQNIEEGGEKYLVFSRGISVIIPFYNAGKTLLETCESLINQKKTKDLKIEVILVDNNSTDASVNIAKGFSMIYPETFRYILCEAQGVSNARNYGISHATCEYIMFLDADDTYSETTLQDVYTFFKKNNREIDIVFFSRFFMYVDNEGNKTYKSHPRNKFFKETGLYEENKNNYMSYFMTLNIAIKNDNLNKFDVNVPYGEDMLFISSILGRNNKIGFVASAHYNYRFSEYSTINKFQSPVYSADLILDNMTKQFAPYIENGLEVPKQVQSIALNEIVWRYESLSNKLFPYHLSKEKYRKWEIRLRDLLRLIDDEIILDYSTMDFFHRMSLFLMKEERLKVAVFDNIDFRKNGVKFYQEENFETVISDFKIVDNKLVLYAFLKMKLAELVNINVFASVNGLEIELSTWESISGRYRKREISNLFPAYKFEFDLGELNLENKIEIYFYYKINGKTFNIKKYYNIKNRILDINDKIFDFDDSSAVLAESTVYDIRIQWLKNFHFILSKLSKNESFEDYEDKTVHSLKNIKDLRDYAISVIDNARNVWLYVDNFNTIDNAFFQYMNDCKKDDEIERYYIYHKDFLYLGKYMMDQKIDMTGMKFVQYGSGEHRKLMVRTSVILASYNEYFATVVPFSRKEMIGLTDVLRFKYIYLQHGVLHAKAPQTYDVERTYIDKIVISSDYEREVFTKELHYDDSSLLQVGMSRFDMPINKENKVNRILFAPSWRDNFVGDLNKFDENGNRSIDIELFIHSQYYKSLTKIISSKSLNKFLESNKLDLDIKLHPIFSGAMEILQPLIEGKKNIHILEEQTVDSANYLIFVTDFSSFVFDAVANKTPIVYYELDRDEFLAGNHSYREFYLGFEFGDVVDNVADFMEKLQKIIQNNYQVESKYLEKMNSFYNFPEHPCEALYQELMAMEESYD